MAINLDEVISSSSSVDDVVAALRNETAAQLRVREQAKQLAQAGQSALNPLEWLKGIIDPRSAAGTLATRDAYRQYYLDAIENGETPMTQKEFVDMLYKQQQKENSNTKQGT